jgi:predicted DNA-binding transcriptional regulator YafY
MAKKTTPIEKAARMLDLVPYITSHQGIGTSELASEFGISEEELLSDLNSLWMCGDNRFDLIDLQFDSGYVTIRNAETLNLIRSLSQQEIISIILGLDLLEKSLSADRLPLLEEISNLRSKLGESISRILDASPSTDGQLIPVLNDGLRDQRRVLISYFSPAGDEISDREITPLHFSVENNLDYLTAYCEKAQAERTFRVDRIKSATLLEAQATYISSATSDPQLLSTQVKISRNLRKSRESLGAFVVGEGSEVTVSTYNSEWLSRTVISAAGAIEVTAPGQMRIQVAELAVRTLQQYR